MSDYNQLNELSWMRIARRYIGTKEIPGAKHSPVILGWWRRIGIAIRDDETPYCAAFVGAVLTEAGVSGRYKPNARSFLDVGVPLARPAYGSVAVFWRGSKAGWSGHVGFVAGRDRAGNLMILGANQSNATNIKPFPRERLLGLVWPSIYPRQERFDLPVLDSDGRVSTNEA